MDKPTLDTSVTQTQVDASLNLSSFSGATPGTKKWHQGPGDGVFEAWALEFGYPEGFPIYGEAKVSSASYHIYYLNDGNKAPVILKVGQKPQDYGVQPKK